jgi:hypothetical protein
VVRWSAASPLSLAVVLILLILAPGKWMDGMLPVPVQVPVQCLSCKRDEREKKRGETQEQGDFQALLSPVSRLEIKLQSKSRERTESWQHQSTE